MAESRDVTRRERGALEPERMSPGPTFMPEVDIIEKADAIVILADMPGVTRDKLDMTLEEGVLSINATVDEAEEEGMSLDRRDYESGSYHRCFTVGEGMDPEGVEATIKDGVLRVTIPKTPKYKPRRIEIRAE